LRTLLSPEICNESLIESAGIITAVIMAIANENGFHSDIFPTGLRRRDR
jgi:hypothetical protein